MPLPLPYEKPHIYEDELDMNTSEFEVEGLGTVVGYFRQNGELHSIKLEDGTPAWIATGGEIPVATVFTPEGERKFLVFVEEGEEGQIMHLEEVTEG